MKKFVILGLVFLFLVSLVYAFEITSYSPIDTNIIMNEGSTQEFSSAILTPSSENLTYNWELYKINSEGIINKVVFTRQGKIFSMDSNGNNIQQLTSELANDTYPSISLDGTKITFVRNGDIWVMNVDGTNQLKLTEKIPTNTTWLFNRPSWTQDNRIVYENNGEILIMNSDGTNQLQLTQKFPENITVTDSFKDPFVSHDGKIYYIYNKMIWVMNADGSNQIQLTYKNPINSSERYSYPSISPDGTKLTYIYKKHIKIEGNPGQTWEPFYIFDGWVQVRGEIVQISPEEWLYTGLEHTSVNVKGGEGVWIMNSDGTNKIVLIERTPKNFIQSFNYVCWLSNDEIIYENNKELYKMNLLTNLTTKLTTKDSSIGDGEWDSYPSCGYIQSSGINSNLVQQSNLKNFTFFSLIGDVGNYILKLNVSDSLTSQNLEWNINVNPYVAPAPTGASVSSGGSGGSSGNHRRPAVVTRPLVQEPVQNNQIQEENEVNEESNQQNLITGQAVKETDGDKGFLVYIKSLFSNIFNWFKNLFN